MIAQANPQIEKAVVVLKELSGDERTRLLEESREKARRDQRSREDHAFEQGMLNTKVEIIKSALEMNMTIHDIAKLTHLTADEIENIAREL